MPLLIILLTLVYAAGVLTLRWGLHRLPPPTNSAQPAVSVVVAARNEAAVLDDCLRALTIQDYPARLEIIIVDDRSTDRTAAIVRKWQQTDPRISLLQVTRRHPGIAPKKYALTRGISEAAGEIILTTDADCCPAQSWVSAIVRHFLPQTGLVAGFSPLENPHESRFSPRKLYALESLSLAAVSAGGIGLNKGLTCSGRNLAYRKQVFEEIGGFRQIAHLISGDDDLFLQLVAKSGRWKLNYAAVPDALVYSAPPERFRDFYHQRTRHASKSRHYHWKLIAGLTLVYLFNLFILLIPIWGLLGWYAWFWIGLAAFVVKTAAEFFLLRTMARRVNKNDLMRWFVIAPLLHIPYVVVFGLLGVFKKFEWKGEIFHAREHT